MPVLPHASTARHVLITVLVQLAPDSAPSVNVGANPAEQLSLTVGAPTAALICACVELQGMEQIAPTVIVGGVKSTILVVAGDSLHAATGLAVPASVEPQFALSTYLVFIL